MSLTSPSLADGFFTTSITWEAQGTAEEAFRERTCGMQSGGRPCRMQHGRHSPGWGPAGPGHSSALTAAFSGNASRHGHPGWREGHSEAEAHGLCDQQTAGGIKRQIRFLVGTPGFLAEGWGEMVAEHMSQRRWVDFATPSTPICNFRL